MVSLHSNRTVTQIPVYNIVFSVSILCDCTFTCKSFYYSPLAKADLAKYVTALFPYVCI